MIVIGIAGTALAAQERDWLQHDAVAGVILFARNFASRAQAGELAQHVAAQASCALAGQRRSEIVEQHPPPLWIDLQRGRDIVRKESGQGGEQARFIDE